MFARVSTSLTEIVPPVAGIAYDNLYVVFDPELEGDYSSANFRVGARGTYTDDFHSLIGAAAAMDDVPCLFLCGAFVAIDDFPYAGLASNVFAAKPVIWQSDWPTQFTTGSESKKIPLLDHELMFWLGYDDNYLYDPQLDMNAYGDDLFINHAGAYDDNSGLRSKRTIPITIGNNGNDVTFNVPVLSFNSGGDVAALAGGFVIDASAVGETFTVAGLSFVNFKFADIKQIFFFEGDLEEYNANNFSKIAETSFFALDDRIEIGGIAVASPIFRGNPVSGLIVGAAVYTEPTEGGVNAVQVDESLTVGDTVFIPTSLIGAYEDAIYQSLTDRGYFVVQRGLITPPPSPISPVRALI